ncbi:MAG: hypothetical protein M1831_003115 [Alyxoria varia]|nr:MAG: hypothetical protein M1831_003115 [Alyxoria varia]
MSMDTPETSFRTMASPPSTINILLSTFPGLGLPSTLCLPIPSTSTLADLHDRISTRLPLSLNLSHSDRQSGPSRLSLTTLAAQTLPYSQLTTLSSFLLPTTDRNTPSNHGDHTYQQTPSSLLPLRLTPLTLGGKGGFGSQLRAAGGKMSSRKKANQQPAPSSNRNLDGRRLRTVGEAKALAEYLAVKPDMDKKEKDERRKRWESIVEMAERRTDEVKAGKAGRDKGDGKWIGEKEELEGKLREDVREAMGRGLVPEVVMEDVMDQADEEGEGSEETPEGSGGPSGSESGAEGDGVEETADTSYKGKGKGKAVDYGASVTGNLEASKGTPNSAAPAPKIWGWDDDDEDDEDLSSDSEKGE